MVITKGNPLLMGTTQIGDSYNFCVSSTSSDLMLNLYPPKGKKSKHISIKLDETYRFGGVFCVLLEDVDLTGYTYYYSEGERHFVDNYAKSLIGVSEFGGNVKKCTAAVSLEEFDWEGDEAPKISFADSVFYKLHVRGYTKHKSSGVVVKGTFAGLTEKVDYLKDLGVTAVVLMPAYDFDETGVRSPKEDNIPPYASTRPLNYWGYTGGNYYAVKASYCADKTKDGSCEFKNMVKTFHKNGMEVIMEFFFEEVNCQYALDCVKYWVKEYHIDGVWLYGNPTILELVANDPMLSDIKVLTVYYEGKGNPYSVKGNKNIGNCNDGFMNVARKFLKGDEDQLASYMRMTIANPTNAANVNYITNHTGFTMWDMVSYEYKHNEANGEDNRDGENYNYSWNCGFEGTTSKKKVNQLRLSQLRNAWMMLMLGQGAPMWFGGDEFLNSQNGNNNPYCQDNEIGWVNWKNTAVAREMTAFVKNLISFRKANKILHMDNAMLMSDYKQVGFPDVSFHGDNAWVHAMQNYHRYAGILYCNEYAKPDEKVTKLIYIAYNMHWEEHYLALPKGSNECKWSVELKSNDNEVTFTEDLRQVKIGPRSIVVLTGSVDKPQPVREKKTSKNRKAKTKIKNEEVK